MTFTDYIALAVFALLWTGYNWATDGKVELSRVSLTRLMMTHRRRWILNSLTRDLKMIDSQIVAGLQAGTAWTLFMVYAALLGAALTSIFVVYTNTSIARVFFISAASFGALSLYGYTTQRDLSAFGSFLIMGLIGIIIASLVNLFLQSSAMHFIISVVGVLVFAGLTAWDTQKIKEMYDVNDDGTVAGRKAVMGALTLYLDFINLFLFLLRFLGERR